MKTIRISNLVYEMLAELAKRNKPSSVKPEIFLENAIEDLYRNNKRF